MSSNILKKRTNFRWFIVFLLFLIIVFNFLDRSAISYILENLQHDFNLSNTQLGLIMGSFSIGFIITSFLGGIALDKYGTKISLTLIIIGWAISMFVMAGASCFFVLLLARILLGLSEGPVIPSVTLATQSWLSSKERITALSFLFIASIIGVVLSGPIVAGLTYWFSWKSMFIILGLFPLICLPVWIIFFKNHPKNSKYVNSLELEYIHPTTTQLAESNNIVEKLSFKTNLKNVLGNPTLVVNMFAYSVFCFYFYFFVSWLPTYLSKTYDISLLGQGGFIIIIWGSATICMILSGRLFDIIYKKTNNLRYVRSYPIILANVVPGICILILLLFKPVVSITIVLIAISISFIMVASPLYYAVNLDVIKHQAGFALGIMEASTSISGFLAPVVSGYIVDITKSFNGVFIFLIILVVICSTCIVLWHQPNK